MYNNVIDRLTVGTVVMMSNRVKTILDRLLWVACGSVLLASPMAWAELKLSIQKDDVQGLFTIDGDVSYDLSTGLVDISLYGGAADAGSDNPLFCFDFSTDERAVALHFQTKSSTSATQVLAEELKLTSALQYQLSASTIAISPADDVACFFRAYDAATPAYSPTFGLYGQAPSASPSPSNEVIFSDDFSGQVNLTIEMGKAGTNQEGDLEYAIEVKNSSGFTVSDIAFQQFIPWGLDVVTKSCVVDGQTNDAVCGDYNVADPTQGGSKRDTLRYVGFDLAPDETLTVTVAVKRNEVLDQGTTALTVYAAVAAQTLSGTVFATAKSELSPL